MVKPTLDKIVKQDFGIPTGDYDITVFQPKMYLLDKLFRKYEAFKKNPHGFKERLDIVKLARLTQGRGDWEAEWMKDSNKIGGWADQTLNGGEESYGSFYDMAKYVEKNKGILIEKIPTDQLYDFVLKQFRVHETREPSEHNNKIYSIKKSREIDRITQNNGDPSQLVGTRVRELVSQMSQKKREFYKWHPEELARLYQMALQEAKDEAKSYFQDDKGKPDRSKIIDFIEANYEAFYDYSRRELPTEAKKEEYFDENKKQFTELGALAYNFIDVEYREQYERETKEREDLAKRLGIEVP